MALHILRWSPGIIDPLAIRNRWHRQESCGSARDWADDDCVTVVNVCVNYKSVSEQTVCTVCTVQNVWWKEVWVRSETGEVTCSTYWVRTAVSQCLSPFGDRSDNQNMYVHSVWVGEWAQGVHEVESTEVCETSLTKNLRGKPAKIRLGKV
jgi:hypothetical protein